MKKRMAFFLSACLALGIVIGNQAYQSVIRPAGPAVMAAAGSDEVPPVGLQMDELDYKTLDIDAVIATRDPEEIVMTVDGKEETWGDYSYFLASQVDTVEKLLISLYANYGAELLWSDVAEEDNTYADMAVNQAEESLLHIDAIEGFAEENEVELTEEDRKALEELLRSDMAASCGEDATEEDFAAYLAGRHMSRELYDRINEADILYQKGFTKLYGEDGGVMDDEAAEQYLEDGSYISANHIMLLTIDPATGEKLDEEVIEERAETAEKLAEELQAIEDPAERLARFAELKEEYCEDTGKDVYPDGYTFTPHTMTADFEAACHKLEPYEVSDPVRSGYGYHIIMKLPYSADALLFAKSGDPITARNAAAIREYDERLNAYMEGMDVEYAEGFEKPDLLLYVMNG